MTHNDVFEACREEVDRVLPNDIEPTNENLADLVICEAIINETLRLYPSAPFFGRYCIREHTIGRENQLRIPIGTTILPVTYPPLAIDPRNCIGQNFALLEAKIILAMFVQRCNFEMIPGQKILPDFKITMRTKYGLLARISKR
ncbi:unnamed protein product [Rotaria sordida]|uniref:Cytochrome P450 n=2 Tax=Rotaria sordida TaxID=392033 RepID=A0A815U3G8_9BILA|nr:unnamed protein product [Rotaria sordida]